jgi:hypothetical protein
MPYCLVLCLTQANWDSFPDKAASALEKSNAPSENGFAYSLQTL